MPFDFHMLLTLVPHLLFTQGLFFQRALGEQHVELMWLWCAALCSHVVAFTEQFQIDCVCAYESTCRIVHKPYLLCVFNTLIVHVGCTSYVLHNYEHSVYMSCVYSI